MPHTYDAHAHVVAETAALLKGGQRALDHDARVGRAIQAMRALLPREILGIHGGPYTGGMVCSILQTQDARWIKALEDHLSNLAPSVRTVYTCNPPFGTGNRAPLEAWGRIFPKPRGFSLFMNMGSYRTISAEELDWLLDQDDLWTSDPTTIIDVIQVTSCTMRSSQQRPVLLAHTTKAWERLDSMPDAPDPRARTGSNLWAMGCARRGWMDPHHHGGSRISQMGQYLVSAHAKMAMMATLRPWTQWVGMDSQEVDARLVDLARRAGGVRVTDGAEATAG